MFEKFVDNLAKLLDKPPYLWFAFIGAVFVIVSIASGRYFDQIWIFFLYSVIGVMWRYSERDFLRFLEDNKKLKFTTIVIYHIGNIGLLFALLYYLNLV